ncbi:hypothetical protein NMG60_11016168 [Bertholletia excelsa]
MQGLQKSKRVCWASDVDLCQVRLFLSNESPAQVGFSAQDCLEAMTSGLHLLTGKSSNDNLPPGFERAYPVNYLKNKLAQIPLMKWKCPPTFAMDLTWQVVAGEESKEVEIQNQREIRMLEAVYPRTSAIPPNPSVPVGTEDSTSYDENTPFVPITSVEDEDAGTDTSIDPTESIIPNPNSKGILIDQDLLMKILCNSEVIEKLVADHKVADSPQIMSVPTPRGVISSKLPPVRISQAETSSPLFAASTSGPFYPLPNKIVPIANSLPPPARAKDINYYKELIQLHGEERQEKLLEFSESHHHQLGAKQEEVYNPRPRVSRSKVMKPCIYFNSWRGCRLGADCLYQHSGPGQRAGGVMEEGQGAKRMKLDREITGQ